MRQNVTGFSLIELVAVVVILSILAVIAVPRMGFSMEETKQAAVEHNLALIRTQLELYKLQHGNKLPHLDENNQIDTDNFIARMTGTTTMAGELSDSGEHGPYVDRWPANPFADKELQRVIQFNGEPDDDHGWYFSTTTAVLSANAGQ